MSIREIILRCEVSVLKVSGLGEMSDECRCLGGEPLGRVLARGEAWAPKDGKDQGPSDVH